MIPIALLASLVVNAPASVPASFTPERVALEGAWRLTQPERKLSIPATVPGVVQADLQAAGKIPAPFYRQNETAVQWVGEVPWTYTRTFTVSPEFTRHSEIRLRCEGLDTLAHIRVNGKAVADTDNMFRTWEFDVKPLLHPGANSIAITFDPIEPYLQAHFNQAAFPNKPVEVHGWGYLRKAPFQQGWDFAPKLITCGVWRRIGLLGWDEARLTDIGVVQDHRTPGTVRLTVDVAADTHVPVTAHAVLSFQGHYVAKSNTPVIDGNATAKLAILHPQLWWPAGMGAQNLYTLHVTLIDSQGRTVDSAERTIGLRTITWIPKTATHPLTLEVNGRPFFAKGTNWVPCDSIISRATAARERRLVDNLVGANMNLVRLWGGGYYEDDAFFDECDRKGLLLWSEFKFADASYPAFDPAWVANVRAEVRDNVRRLRLHPSIAVWSGNNEVIGFVADKTDPSHMTHQDYDLLFHHVIPDTVHEIAPEAVYTPGSPESGDEHDWSVWHGNSSFESYRDVHGFMSEFGFQAFPQPKTVDAYTNAGDRASVLSPTMKFHQRNWRDGNLLILSMLKRYYHAPKDFNSTLWLSQIQQADGVLTGVENWRRDWPNSTGSLVWQYDDCWPTASWSMMDYYGRPKALWYRLSRAYAPVMLSGLVDRGSNSAALWVSNDRRRALQGQLDWRLLRLDGVVIDKGSQVVAIPAGTSSTRVLLLNEKQAVQATGSGNLLLWAQLRVPGEPISTTTLVFAKPKALNLVAAGIRTSVTQSGGSFRVTLTAAHPALWAWIDLVGIDAHYSDNFVSLIPDEPLTITVTPTVMTSLARMRSALKVRSLYDTYLPMDKPDTGQPPAVSAQSDGKIIVTAEQADIKGDETAYLEPGPPGNIGNWSDMNDFLVWSVKGAKPGRYSVAVNLSCPPGEEGSKYVVSVGGQQVTGIVPATAGWTSYTDVSLGIVQIASPGDAMPIVLKPLSKPGGHVMNLRSITLTFRTDN